MRAAPVGFDIHTPREGEGAAVLAALGEWMDPRRAAQLLPAEYLVRFADTSLVASLDDEVAGFLVAFPSSHVPQMGYVHFVWVAPHFRGAGLGRALYERGLDLLRSRGCRRVEAVASTRTAGAVAFHEHLGFVRDDGGTGVDFEPADGMVVLTRAL